jgi:hypothetical protein
MDARQATEIESALQAAHSARIDQRGGAELQAALSRAIRGLPGGSTWAVLEDAPGVIALAGHTVFQIEEVAEGAQVRLASRPLDAERLTVALEWGRAATTPLHDTIQQTSWTFGHLRSGVSAPWLQIAGAIEFARGEPERPDRRELFARAVADKAGWAFPVPAAPPEP